MSEMDLQKELGAVAQMVREKTPPHVMPTIEATRRRLEESRLKDRALQPGQTMSDFELPDATGEIVRSVELRSQGPLLITFYREVGAPSATWPCWRSRNEMQKSKLGVSLSLRFHLRLQIIP